MSTPLVSIGLPIFNSKKKIIRVIKSLLNQDYKNIEIIITDNSNNLESFRIVKKIFRSKKIKYFKNKKNFGSILNHNKSLSKSTGKYFMWIHDVDIISKNYISSCIHILEQDQTKVAVMGKIIYTKNHKTECEYREPNFNEDSMFLRVKKFLLSDYPDTLMCALFRKRNKKYLKGIVSPEIIFILNLIIKGKVSGTSKTKFIKGNDSNRTMEQIKKNYEGDNQFFKNNLFRRYGRYFYVFKEIYNSNSDFLKKLFLYLIYIQYHFPLIRFFFKKQHIYYYKKK